jgi:hypothetical protein
MRLIVLGYLGVELLRQQGTPTIDQVSVEVAAHIVLFLPAPNEMGVVLTLECLEFEHLIREMHIDL